MAKARKASNFTFLEHTIAPGTRATVELQGAKLYTNSPLSIPIEVMHGRLPGPVLMINAAIHGDELNGVEIVRQTINTIDVQRLRGTLIMVPVVNIFGFIQKSRYLPDRRDLNRCFPGSERGSLASRLAHTFFSDVVLKCNYIIDLHTAAIHRTNLPQLRVNLEAKGTLELAQAFASPVIIDSPLRDGSLRSEAEKVGITVITYEGGEALKFDPIAISAGLAGIKRVMQCIGMLRASRKKQPSAVIAKSTTWLRAEHDGILRTLVSLGDTVEAKQIIGYIHSPLGDVEVPVVTNKSGIVIGQQTLPLVNEGDAIFHIAHLHENDHQIDQVVEEFIDDINRVESDLVTSGYILPASE